MSKKIAGHILWLVCFAVLFSSLGCNGPRFRNRATVAGVQDMMKDTAEFESFDDAHLAELIDPAGLRRYKNCKSFVADFSLDEFGDESKAKALVSTISKSVEEVKSEKKAAVASLAQLLKSSDSAVVMLNKLIRVPAFYDGLKVAAPDIFMNLDFSSSKHEINSLTEETDKYRNKEFFDLSHDEQTRIKKLNRLLIEALYPASSPKGLVNVEDSELIDNNREIIEVERALHCFDFYDNPTDRRNKVQGRLIMASEQRCNLYKGYLKQMSSHESFLMGSLSTVLGGVGALVSPVSTAQIFAGAAGITSGINAQFKDSYFYNMASQVIIPGIENKQETFRREVFQAKKGQSISEYSVEEAIADSLRYHGLCSLDTGLKEASEAITKSGDEVGPKKAEETIKQYLRSYIDKHINRLAGSQLDNFISTQSIPELIKDPTDEGNRNNIREYVKGLKSVSELQEFQEKIAKT